MRLILIVTTLAIILPVVVAIIFTTLSSRSIIDREKMSPFECGFDPNHSARIPFSLRFFLLAIIFIVFDIEIVLLIPLPIITTSYSIITLIRSRLFLIILLLGLLHE